MTQKLMITGILLVYSGFVVAIAWNFVISSNLLSPEELQLLFETMTGIGLEGENVHELVQEALVFDFNALKAGIIIGSVILPMMIMVGVYAVAITRRLERPAFNAPVTRHFIYNMRRPIRITTMDPMTSLPQIYAVQVELLSRSRPDLITLSARQDDLRQVLTEEVERLNAEALVQVPQLQMEHSLLEAGQSVVGEALARVRIKQSWVEEMEDKTSDEALSEAA